MQKFIVRATRVVMNQDKENQVMDNSFDNITAALEFMTSMEQYDIHNPLKNLANNAKYYFKDLGLTAQ